VTSTAASADAAAGHELAAAARAVLASPLDEERRARAARARAAAGTEEPHYGLQVTCDECGQARTFPAATEKAIADVMRLGCPTCGARWDLPHERPEPELPAPVLGPARTVVLVACSDAKSTRAGKHAAVDLYVSPLFRKSLDYARTLVGDRDIRILSALHGAVRLDARLAAYDWTLHQMSLREREQWGTHVVARLVGDFGRGPVEATVLAGVLYIEALHEGLFWSQADWKLLLPFGGKRGVRLSVGKRLRWLNQHNNTPHAALARWLNRSASSRVTQTRAA
jgi:hypothetical protein